jgi:hypothetical protein
MSDVFIFSGDGYSMDDIIDIYEGEDLSEPPQKCICVCSSSRGLQRYPMTLENRHSFAIWQAQSLAIAIAKKNRTTPKFN